MQEGSLLMRKSRRRHVVPLVVFALVVAGGITAGLTLVANAQDELASCSDSGTNTAVNCSILDTDTSYTTSVSEPSSIEALVTLSSGDGSNPSDQYVLITYSVYCSLGGEDTTTQNSTTDDTFAISTSASVTDTLTLGYTDPDSCEVISLEAQLEVGTTTGETTTYSPTTTGNITMDLEWTPQSSSSTTTSSSSSVDVPYVYGYSNKCIDDRGNSSSSGAQIIIWGCNHGDSAQYWTWTGYELRHDGMCANDPGYGGSGTKLILYSCTGTSNEKWSHVSYGEFKLYYTGKGQLCLDDPAYSTTNGTRLMVYKCNNGSNQRWARS
jgi:hypothetical protein